MAWESPKDAVPWVGLYIGVASLVCTLAMAADLFQGFRQRPRKLWFPCRFFIINAASITLIAIAMKLPVDLTTDMPDDDLVAKYVSIFFLLAMLANFLPSLGLMGDKELFSNIIAFGILIITIAVNVWIQMSTKVLPARLVGKVILMFPLLWPFSVALTVKSSRRVLELRYKDFHRSTTNQIKLHLSTDELTHCVKKYWIMAETGNPQFVIACSPISCAFGVLCFYLDILTLGFLIGWYLRKPLYTDKKSDYKWSIEVILIVQSVGTVVATIAPIFRCFTATTYFQLNTRWSLNHLNVFRVEKHWTGRLQHWKQIHVDLHIPNSHCRKVIHTVKNMILNFCMAFHIAVLVICKSICLIPRCCLICVSGCCYFRKSLFRGVKEEQNTSTTDATSELERYTTYVVQIEEEAELSEKISRSALNSISRLLQESEKYEPRNLIKLLEKSKGFMGVIEFVDDEVPTLLNKKETRFCWSLVIVTLTSIAIAIPNIDDGHLKGLLASMKEGLEFSRHIEESFNTNGDLVKARKAAKRIWPEIELYRRWLKIDLQKNACKGSTSKEIIQQLADETEKILKKLKSCKKGSLDDSRHKFIASNSMYRISLTIMRHCDAQENWPTDEELFQWISTMIADILCACFTNLPRVITSKCHHKAIEKRIDSIWSAAQLLGRSKPILSILEARQLPNLDLHSRAYLDMWHALPKNEIPNGCVSQVRGNTASPYSNESTIVNII
uniref:uncharacterized protein LOC122583735 n=1 Tax=Erigeron canadensis TaxID=72917 RepID=UPI001CB8E3B4|nr:uncharacterized protein LOC122583735 [Erigeron canadensis]